MSNQLRHCSGDNHLQLNCKCKCQCFPPSLKFPMSVDVNVILLAAVQANVKQFVFGQNKMNKQENFSMTLPILDVLSQNNTDAVQFQSTS